MDVSAKPHTHTHTHTHNLSLPYDLTHHLLGKVATVLGELVAVAAADRKSFVRRAVLQALEPHLDRYLVKVCRCLLLLNE